MPPDAPLPPLALVTSGSAVDAPKRFQAPECWDKSPIMRLLSPSPDPACTACGYPNDLSQIFASPVEVLCASRAACQSQYGKGGDDGCFLCTIVVALLDVVGDADLDHGNQCAGGSATTAVSAKAGSFIFTCGEHCTKSKAWQVFIPEPSPQGLPNVPILSLLHGSSSPHALKFLKTQIKTCLKSHAQCQVVESDYTPTRLLHIAKDGKIQLRFHSDIPKGAKYTALSHRWGRDSADSCLTTRANIEDRKNNIPWDDLPQLFHDTVSLTLGLGASYVWIDSLCIVQDDSDDWGREAASMMPIFSNALITIAALYADGPSATIFPRLSDLQHKLLTVQRGHKKHQLYARELLTDPPGVIYHAIPPRTASQRDCGPTTSSAPLLRRAWAFQDCLVSSRIAYVGAQEITFECRTGITCECGLHRFEDAIGARHALAKSTRRLSFTARLFSKAAESDGWEDLVEHYSSLELTSEEDRLLALGGYAQQHLQAHPGQQYLAGLWSGSLSQQLLWTTSTPQRGYSTTSSCVAPSWSWASASSPIIFPWRRDDTLRTTFVIRQKSCRSKDGNPFGAAMEGWLQLRGCLIEARLSYDDQNRNDNNGQGKSRISIQSSDGRILRDVRLDRPLEHHSTDINVPDDTRRPDRDPVDTRSDASFIDEDIQQYSEAVYLLKVLETESTDGEHHKTQGYMILTRASQSGNPIRLRSSSLRIYRRLGMAVHSTAPNGEVIEDGHTSEKQRPGVRSRRSSSAVFVEGLTRMLSFGDSSAKDTEIVLC